MTGAVASSVTSTRASAPSARWGAGVTHLLRSTLFRSIARRVIVALITLFGVVTIVFFIVRLSGNPAIQLLPSTASPSDVATLSRTLGFDKPVLTQYLNYLGGLLHGDMGQSYALHVPALGVVMQRLPLTLQLAMTSWAIGLAVAVGFALLVHITGSTKLRATLLWLGALRQAIPVFLFGILVVLVFAVTLRLLPSIGSGSAIDLVLPVFTMASFEVSLYLRLLDSSLSEQSSSDYVRTALSKGQSWPKVVVKHMLPNALLPLLTIAGLNLGALLGGTVIVEMVFGWSGLGQLILSSINGRDFPVIQAGLLVIGGFFILVNLLADSLQAVLDPRMRRD
jgi:peptide/nickel transport system permease protein